MRGVPMLKYCHSQPKKKTTKALKKKKKRSTVLYLQTKHHVSLSAHNFNSLTLFVGCVDFNFHLASFTSPVYFSFLI
jgi:hypothetical protein